MKLEFLSAAITVLMMFSSCQKEGNTQEEKPKCKLVKVTQGLDPDTDSVYQFRYNSNGLPSAMTMEFATTVYFDWMDFVYMPGTSILDKIWGGDPQDPFLIQYEYDAQNKLIKSKYFLGQQFTYQYDNEGQLSRVDAADGGYPKDYYFETGFDKNGNLTTCYRRKIADNSFLDGFTVEYSDIENTLGLLSALNISENIGTANLFPGSHIYPVPSKHLAKSLTGRNANGDAIASISHTFERDASNNITKAVLRRDNWGSLTGEINTWKFEYECK